MEAKEQKKHVPTPKYRVDTPRGMNVTQLAGLEKGDTVYFTHGNHIEPARVTSVKKFDRDFVAVNVKMENKNKVLRFTGPLYWDVAIGDNGMTMQTARLEGRKLSNEELSCVLRGMTLKEFEKFISDHEKETKSRAVYITEQAVEMAFYRGLAACFKLLTGEELEYYQQIWNYGKEK